MNRALCRRLSQFIRVLFLSLGLIVPPACYASTVLVVGGGAVAALAAIIFALGGKGGDGVGNITAPINGFRGFYTTDGAITAADGAEVGLLADNISPPNAAILIPNNDYVRLRTNDIDSVVAEGNRPYHPIRIPPVAPIIHPYDPDRGGGDQRMQFPLVVKLSNTIL